MTYYFSILILSISIPFIFSFHPRIQFYKKFGVLLKSIPISSIIFIIWDIIFTHYEIWGFNKNLVSNLFLFNLPIEEVLFFIVIPFCCLYTFYIIELYEYTFFNIKSWRNINLIFSALLIIIGIINFSKTYTLYCFLFCGLLIFFTTNIKIKINYNNFYTSFALLMIPFVIVNGALTGLFFDQTIVWYNQTKTLGIRLLTIPLEDVIYSYQLILLNIICYKSLS